MHQLVTDIRSGVRMLFNYPTLSLIAVLTLGLGIGLSTTVFCVVNGGAAPVRSVLVVPYDLDVCRAYGRLGSLKTSEGTARNLSANDRWIAACALRHNLALVSNNRRHFEGIPDLKLISEAPVPRRPRSQRLPLSEESQ